MSWLTNFAERAENILTNLDEKTGAALKNHNVVKPKKLYKNDTSKSKLDRISRSPSRRTVISDLRSNSPPQRIAPPHRCMANEIVRKSHTKHTRKKNPSICNLNRGPTTLVDDVIQEDEIDMHDYGCNKRRLSLPADLEKMFDRELTTKVENLDMENAVLRRELEVMSNEVAILLNNLKKSEDDLDKANMRIDRSDEINNELNVENCLLKSQIQDLKTKVDNLMNVELEKLKGDNETLVYNMEMLKAANMKLEENINENQTQYVETKTKLENDLCQSEDTVNNLRTELKKSQSECQTLGKEWEAYKLRVKAMLNSKDKEIQAFQDGVQKSDVAIVLNEQVDSLRQVHEDLQDELDRSRNECQELKAHAEKSETKAHAAERLVVALREALREERNERTKIESDFLSIKKEQKRYQTETTERLNSLEKLLHEKDSQIHQLKDLSVSTIDNNSSLNVADYDVMAVSVANDKIAYLTDTLVEKQTKIDSLLSERNMLRIQLDKLDSKYKTEVNQRSSSHSIVDVNDCVGDARNRTRAKYIPESVFNKISLRIGVFIRRNPLFRLLIIIYMVGLHLWVALVLLTYTPEEHPDSGNAL